jgi:hypothetical protein
MRNILREQQILLVWAVRSGFCDSPNATQYIFDQKYSRRIKRRSSLHVGRKRTLNCSRVMSTDNKSPRRSSIGPSLYAEQVRCALCIRCTCRAVASADVSSSQDQQMFSGCCGYNVASLFAFEMRVTSRMLECDRIILFCGHSS